VCSLLAKTQPGLRKWSNVRFCHQFEWPGWPQTGLRGQGILTAGVVPQAASPLSQLLDGCEVKGDRQLSGRERGGGDIIGEGVDRARVGRVNSFDDRSPRYLLVHAAVIAPTTAH
jgi:hypothetical protein